MGEQTIGYTATLVLQALARGHHYGFEIMRQTQLASGAVYPILRRLEAGKYVRSQWEDTDPTEAGRPARRLYQMTRKGEQALAEAVKRVAAQQRLFEGVVHRDVGGTP